MKIEILVIGRHPQIMETVLRLINSQEGWHALGALNEGEANNLFSNSPFDLVLIGGGIEDEVEERLSSVFRKIKPAIKVVRHYGGGSGLLFNEIISAMN